MKDIKLQKNHLLIELDTRNVTKAGVHLTPESAEREAREATYGKVVVIGPKAEFVKEDDFVLYKKYVGNELKHYLLNKDNRYVVVSEDDVLAVVPRDVETIPNAILRS